jgi:hypothetical protein
MKNELLKKYEQSRGNLLLTIILTVVNIALLFTPSNTMFLFSITIPYWAASFGYFLEMTGFYIVAGVVLLLYLIFWIFSKKHYGWFIPALILFVLDMVFLGYVSIDIPEAFDIIDVLVHIWVLYYLGAGIYFGYKLKHLPVVEENNEATEEASENALEDVTITNAGSSTPLRMAEDVKHRVFVEADYQGHHICYRHVKGANEFVVDGNVYGVYTKIIEPAHSLNAKIDNLDITVGYDGAYHSYIKVNGNIIAKKVRFF